MAPDGNPEVHTSVTVDMLEVGFIVRGRVINKMLSDYTGLEVRVEDAEGTTLTRSKTDPNGYYSFTFGHEGAEFLKKKSPTDIILSIYDREGTCLGRIQVKMRENSKKGKNKKVI